MLNPQASYIEAGYKCARARIQGDEARAQHWREFFSRMRSHEKTQGDKAEARYLFDQGYAEAQPARR